MENVSVVRRFGAVPPSERGFQAGSIYGCGLIIHGGTASFPGAEILGDWHLFDIGLGSWITVEVFMKPPGGVPLPSKPFILNRKMHRMTSVYCETIPTS